MSGLQGVGLLLLLWGSAGLLLPGRGALVVSRGHEALQVTSHADLSWAFGKKHYSTAKVI